MRPKQLLLMLCALFVSISLLSNNPKNYVETRESKSSSYLNEMSFLSQQNAQSAATQVTVYVVDKPKVGSFFARINGSGYSQYPYAGTSLTHNLNGYNGDITISLHSGTAYSTGKPMNIKVLAVEGGYYTVKNNNTREVEIVIDGKSAWKNLYVVLDFD